MVIAINNKLSFVSEKKNKNKVAIALLGLVYHLQVIESERKEHAPQTACSQKEEKRIHNISFKNSLSRLSLYPREGHGNRLQYSCLENPMDRGAWQATVHRVAKSWTRFSMHAYTFVFIIYTTYIWDFPHRTVGKESACNAGHLGLIPGLGRSPVEGNGNPLQCSCLENPRDKEWQATVHGVTRVRHDLATKPPRLYIYLHCNCICKKF